jgi:hypothetical protein
MGPVRSVDGEPRDNSLLEFLAQYRQPVPLGVHSATQTPVRLAPLETVPGQIAVPDESIGVQSF